VSLDWVKSHVDPYTKYSYFGMIILKAIWEVHKAIHGMQEAIAE